MKKYRIVKHTTEWIEPAQYGAGIRYNRTSYEVQKRFLGFLWWYNPFDIDGMATGQYDTLLEAQAVVNRINAKTKDGVIGEYE